MGILTAQQSAEINRAGTSGMGHLRVMRTTDASWGAGGVPAKFVRSPVSASACERQVSSRAAASGGSSGGNRSAPAAGGGGFARASRCERARRWRVAASSRHAESARSPIETRDASSSPRMAWPSASKERSRLQSSRFSLSTMSWSFTLWPLGGGGRLFLKSR